jgi:CRISPR-associated endonuclease/helicase Cas3
MAQAAGRCNREGLLDHGKLFVFEPADVRLMGYLKSVATTASEILPLYDDLLGLDAISHYFRQHYWDQASRWDQHEVMACFPGGREMLLQFRTAAERFQVIRDSGHSVFVPFGSMARKIEIEIRSRLFRDNGGYRREVLRKASRHMVSIFPNVYTALLGNDIELVHEQVPILLNTSLYDSRTGLRTDRTGQHEPETLIL